MRHSPPAQPAPSPIGFADQRTRVAWGPAWLALYVAFVFLWNLGAAPLTDVDEGAFSEATREMLERGDFVTTYLDGDLRFDKPILTYWLQAVPVALFGPVEWAFRLPSALAACLWVALLFRFARRYAPGAAIPAAFMLASALGPLMIGRVATADALLNCFVAGALFAVYRWLERGVRRDLVATFAWIGLGVLAKGPVAIAVPALAVIAYCASRREWLRPLALLADPLAWAAFAAIALPWYVAEYLDQGQRFVDGFFLKHNVGRFTATMLGHGGYWWYYLAWLPVLAFPFFAPLAGAVREVRAAAHDDLQRFLWCAFASVFVFFSFSRTQLPHYVLYGAAPLFLLMAIHRRRYAHPLALILPVAAAFALAGAVPWLVRAALPRVRNEPLRVDLAELGTTIGSAGTLAMLVLAVLVIVVGLRAVRQHGADAALFVAGGTSAIALVAVTMPFAISWFQAPVVEAAQVARTRPETVVQWNANWPSFSVYRRAVTPRREPREGEVVLTRRERVAELPPHEVLFARRDVVLAKVRAPRAGGAPEASGAGTGTPR